MPMQGDAMTVAVCTGNEMIDTDIRLLADVVTRECECLEERFALLSSLLKTMGC